MITLFGKFCRVLRIKHSEVLRDMAEKLGVSSSYLSAVETGKREIPSKWRNELIRLYKLTKEESEELIDAINQTRGEVSFDLTRFSDDDRARLIAFARKWDDFGKENKIPLNELFTTK